MSSTSSISGGGESQWQLLKELRASQTAASQTTTYQTAASQAGSTSAPADTPIPIAPPTSSGAAAPSSTGGLGSVASKLVADLQSFLLSMQSGTGADAAGAKGAGSGSTSTASQLSQQFASSIQAYSKQAGGLAGISAAPSLAV